MRKCMWILTDEYGKTDDPMYGYFHQFGTDAGSDSDGKGITWTIAIVEDLNGRIGTVNPASIRFIAEKEHEDKYADHTKRFGF